MPRGLAGEPGVEHDAPPVVEAPGDRLVAEDVGERDQRRERVVARAVQQDLLGVRAAHAAQQRRRDVTQPSAGGAGSSTSSRRTGDQSRDEGPVVDAAADGGGGLAGEAVAEHQGLHGGGQLLSADRKLLGTPACEGARYDRAGDVARSARGRGLRLRRLPAARGPHQGRLLRRGPRRGPDVRRRGAREGRGPGRRALRRPLGQAARPPGRTRARDRPLGLLHRQRGEVPAAGQPGSAAGRGGDLPPLPRRPGRPRRPRRWSSPSATSPPGRCSG